MIAVGQTFTQRRGFQLDFQFLRDLQQVFQIQAALLAGELAAHLAQVEGEQEQHCHLSSERLGRSDADLRAGKRVKHAIGLARDGGIYHVRDCNRP